MSTYCGKLGKSPTVFVEGKTLTQIAEENTLNYNTVKTRYRSGDRTLKRLGRPLEKNIERRVYSISDAGQRILEIIYKTDYSLSDIARGSGISRPTLYSFLYEGKDLSSMRLAKVCAFLHCSMDYVMGLKKEA